MLRYINDTTTAALEKALQGQALRQRAVANNIANVDTPGYRPQRVEFEAQLQAALARETDDDPAAAAAIDQVTPSEETPVAAPLRRDGNAVDIEHEMVALAESGLNHQVLVRLLSKKMQMLKSVATEGGR
jgi:flagellar basal-body rod protein FlgB